MSSCIVQKIRLIRYIQEISFASCFAIVCSMPLTRTYFSPLFAMYTKRNQMVDFSPASARPPSLISTPFVSQSTDVWQFT
jgi:hypothetical protein